MSKSKVAVLVGSLRKGSVTRAVAEAIIRQAPDSLTFEFVEIGDLPLYNPDLEADAPAAWTRFREQMKTADAVIFATPEYNRSVPAALKYAIDVGTRPWGQSVWPGKPALVVSVSPGAIGGFGANHHLRQSLVFLDMPTVQQPEAYIGHAGDLLDEAGEPKTDNTRAYLKSIIDALAGLIDRYKAAAD